MTLARSLVATLLVPASAGAFVLLQRNPGPGLGPTRWLSVNIVYRHNTANAPAGIDGPDLVDQAFATWTGVPSATIAFSRGADTTASGFNMGDGINAITWEDPDDDLEIGVLAANVIYVPSGTTHVNQAMNFYEITQSDVVFNDGLNWTDSNGATALGGCTGNNEFDTEAVALHEIGHFLGLDHPTGSYASAIMYPAINGCDATRTSPKVDDVNGVTFLYDSGVPPVYPAFALDDSEGYAPHNVGFSDNSTGTVTSRAWSFGDGGTSAATNPSYDYDTPGVFDVTLTVNGSAALEKVNAVTVYPMPQVEFSADVLEGKAPLTVSFVNESTDVGPDPRYRWQFDGETAFDENPQHEFEAGTYTVTLSVDGGAGYIPNEKVEYIVVKGEEDDELFPGCSCRVAGGSASRSSAASALLLALLGVFRMRSRARSGP